MTCTGLDRLDANPMLERAELLERFGAFERRGEWVGGARWPLSGLLAKYGRWR